MRPISCVVPAAGFSRRAPSGNKLLERLPDGRRVVAALVGTLLEAGVAAEIVVVTGHQAERLGAALEGLPVRLVFATGHAAGMGASLAEGVRACDAAAGGFMICPADLPWLKASTVALVAREYERLGGSRHVLPEEGGRRGHPVLLAPRLRGALAALDGDLGARELLRAEEALGLVGVLPVSDQGIHRDADLGLSRA